MIVVIDKSPALRYLHQSSLCQAELLSLIPTGPEIRNSGTGLANFISFWGWWLILRYGRPRDTTSQLPTGCPRNNEALST